MSSALEPKATLDVLCIVTQIALQSHRTKALLAFQNLQIFVDKLGPVTTSIPPASSVYVPLCGVNNNSSLSRPSYQDWDPSIIAPNNSPGPQDSHSSSIVPSSPSSSPGKRSMTLKTDRLIQSLNKQSTQIQDFYQRQNLKLLAKSQNG